MKPKMCDWYKDGWCINTIVSVPGVTQSTPRADFDSDTACPWKHQIQCWQYTINRKHDWNCRGMPMLGCLTKPKRALSPDRLIRG